MDDVKLLLYVENESDVFLVERLLKVAHYPLEHIKILPSNGKKNLAHFMKSSWKLEGVKYAALLNFDAHTVFEAIEQSKKYLGLPETEILFCAVPTIEAWLFADIEAAKRNVYSEHGHKLLNRVSLPEEIPHPRRLAYSVFGQQKVEQYAAVFDTVDLEIATSRSPSLKNFLEGMNKLLDINNIPTTQVYSRTINRDIFSNLLRPRCCCSACQANAAASAGKDAPKPAASAIQASIAAIAVLPSSTVLIPVCGGVVELVPKNR